MATPVRPLAGIAAAVLGAAAGLHMFATPAAGNGRHCPGIAGFDLFYILKLGAEAIATQTDMYARPQMSDQKGQKTGQVDEILSSA